MTSAEKIMWERSVFKGFHYTTLVSDGNTKTFRPLSDLNVYSEDVALAKEKCFKANIWIASSKIHQLHVTPLSKLKIES